MQYKMKKISKRRLTDLSFIICHLTFSTALLASCSIMQEDRSDCPTCYNPVHLVLKYDYNIHRADMYADHVRQATCYIVDNNGTIVAKDEAIVPAGQKMPNAFNFEELPEGNYRAYAVARTPSTSNPSSSTIRIEVPSLSIGDHISTLQPFIPRVATLIANDRYDVPSSLPLDTLWMGHSKQTFHLQDRVAALDTVSLVRDTKNLNIMLAQQTNPTDNGHGRYDVFITDENGLLDCDNEVLADKPLTYRPYASWTTETTTTSTVGTDSVVARTAHFDLSFGRLMSHSDATKNARLIIRNHEDGTTIVDLDLVHILSLARNAFNRNYSIQEYLDREYDYYLDFVLMGNQWKELAIRINLLSWAFRIQNEEL